MISKINIILIALVGILTFGLFVVWRSNVQKTKQIEFQTQQIKYLVEHPKIEYKQGPTKIVEKVVVKYSSNTIVSAETETITEIARTSYTSEPSEPMIEQQTQITKEKVNFILVGCEYNDRILFSLNREFFTSVVVGIGITYNWNKSEVKPLVILQYRF
jgi:type II secretory pathway pseudopilin PulG